VNWGKKKDGYLRSFIQSTYDLEDKGNYYLINPKEIRGTPLKIIRVIIGIVAIGSGLGAVYIFTDYKASILGIILGVVLYLMTLKKFRVPIPIKKKREDRRD
jgi:hypothetical protein